MPTTFSRGDLKLSQSPDRTSKSPFLPTISTRIWDKRRRSHQMTRLIIPITRCSSGEPVLLAGTVQWMKGFKKNVQVKSKRTSRYQPCLGRTKRLKTQDYSFAFFIGSFG